MKIPVRSGLLFLAVFLLFCESSLIAQQTANANPYYQQLRGLLPAPDVITVSNLELRRDAATFTFRNGSIAFYGQVNGKVTGAVFLGQGHLHITPPTPVERHNLSVFFHSEEFDEDFNQAVLRFTDDSAAELRANSKGKGGYDTSFTQAGQEFQHFARLKLHDNFDLRILGDVLSPSPGGFFLAGVHGLKNNNLVFQLDPHGVSDVAPEEVALFNWSEWGVTIPLAFHRASEYKSGTASGNERNASAAILNENLDISIEKNGFLSSIATVEARAASDGTSLIPLNLYPTLRVSRVETDKGIALDFVQEKKDEDPDFGVVLAKPLSKGETVTLRITYGGKDVVKNEGGANYYPIARESWYPSASSGLGDYATYHMLFHVPKGLEVIATGTKVGETTDGKITTSEWKTDMPLAVVGFNLGQFTMKETKVPSKLGKDLSIDAYADTTPPDNLQYLGEENGSFSPKSMLPVELSEGEVAVKIYNSFFGELPFTHIALTQQYACNYGQSWPMLVFLPACGFLDSTQQHNLGLHPEDMYWKVVTPHEVAHQWWGQTVGFRSYRDQWMSEGFADASASIFLQLTRPKPDDFRDFWKQQRKLITEKNAEGFRPIDVGPVTMGIRLSSPKAGWDTYDNLVYPKGAYILHMIRMMMWSNSEGDARFKATMHDFLDAHRLQPATTEDFKAAVEKNMRPGMDLDGNHKMDWFFNEYVYGTELPEYHFEGQITQTSDAATLHYKLSQAGVSPGFKMIVPIYVEQTDGKILYLGSTKISGVKTEEQTAQIPKPAVAVKRVFINYNYDVLSTEK